MFFCSIRSEEVDNAEPVQLYWKADKQAIHQLDDDGTLTKSFSFGKKHNQETVNFTVGILGNCHLFTLLFRQGI